VGSQATHFLGLINFSIFNAILPVQEYIRISKEIKSAKDLVDGHLDPNLTAADELVGKVK
jgi:hypothetical protein